MDKSFLLRVAESKVSYHKKQARMAYEEKVKIIIELQKIKHEFLLNHGKNINPSMNVWRIQL